MGDVAAVAGVCAKGPSNGRGRGGAVAGNGGGGYNPDRGYGMKRQHFCGMASMRVEDEGLIYDASQQPECGHAACFASLAPLASGAVLSCFQAGPKKNAADSTLKMCRSDDGGRSWREVPVVLPTTLGGVPGSLSSGELVEVEPGRLLLLATWFDRTDPDRPLFDPETEGILHSRLLKAVSEDDGATWSAWAIVGTSGLTGCAGTGPLVKWPDGTIACPFESYKEYDDPRPGRHGAWIVVSQDGGRTFGDPVLVAQHPDHRIYYWDQRLCFGGEEGKFLAMFWTHDLEHKQDLSVHFQRASLAPSDGGREPIVATTIPGQIAAPLVLDDGRVVTFVVDRGQPGTMTLWQSADGGATWPEDDALVVYTHDERALLSQGRSNVDFKQYWEDMGKWSFGHPAVRQLDDGRLLVAYYAGTPECLSVRWARVVVSE